MPTHIAQKAASGCKYMSFMLTHKLQTKPGSHFAIIDSGTPIHIFFDDIFVRNKSENHTAVSGFSGTAGPHIEATCTRESLP